MSSNLSPVTLHVQGWAPLAGERVQITGYIAEANHQDTFIGVEVAKSTGAAPHFDPPT